MFQQNNNNNYPCLQRVCGNRDILLDGVEGYIPSVRHLHDLGRVKGFRTWVVSTKTQIGGQHLKPILKLADPAPCFRMVGGIAPRHANDPLGNLRPRKARTKNTVKQDTRTFQEDKQDRESQSQGTESFQHTLVKNCAKHHEAESTAAASLRKKGKECNQSRHNVDAESKSCRMPEHLDSRQRSSEVGREDPAKADVHKFQSKSPEITNSCFLDSLGNQSDEPSTGCTGDVKASMKCKNDVHAVCVTETLKYLLAKIESKKTTESEIPQKQNQKSNGGSSEGMMEKLPRRWVTTDVPERHSCMETGSVDQGCGPCSLVHQGLFSSTSGEENCGKNLRSPQKVETELLGIKQAELSADSSSCKTQSGQISEVQAWLEAKWVVKEPNKQALLLISSEEGGMRSAIFPSRGLDSAPSGAAHVCCNLVPSEAGKMVLTLPSRWQTEVESRMPALPTLEEPEQQEKCKITVTSVEECVDVEQDDDFGLFVQAIDHPSWDSDKDLHQVPCDKSERPVAESYATEGIAVSLLSDGRGGQLPQSEDTWIAFQDDVGPQLGKGQEEQLPKQPEGQWWPPSAVEDKNPLPSPKTSDNVSGVILDAFPSTSPPCCNPDSIMSLRQLVQSNPATDNRGLLGELQDVNRVIGLKYKWTESHSHKLLLNSLHLDQCSKNHVNSSRPASDSSSRGASMTSEKSPLIGYGRMGLSHPISKNILA
ncbi:uncharacterized protein LOC108928693 isoform X2 [Scleropages formosus]|uniref:uncharacterized protein LOC108928693 isoform X2 n=1 Tax=Scleropages formosus TaxID=113540 RepID=UPI000878AB1A|nr:uncharacterized protein LOC108928693 isoform X2 [Scleropages formosus]